jgi:hypothetical protein
MSFRFHKKGNKNTQFPINQKINKLRGRRSEPYLLITLVSLYQYNAQQKVERESLQNKNNALCPPPLK